MRTEPPEPRPLARVRQLDPTPYVVLDCEYLPRPSLAEERGFFSVLEARHSRRDFAPIARSDLATLFWYSAKIKGEFATSTGHWQHRTPPSAGGCHPIDLWVVERSRIQWYDPVGHALCEIQLTHPGTADALFREVDAVVPVGDGTVIWLVARPERTTQAYINAESLIWRDAGVLLATLIYSAEALGLSICPVGILGTSAVQRALSGGNGVAAGGCVVGSRRPPLEAS